MQISITFNNGDTVVIPIDKKTSDTVKQDYPVMGMMCAMEELAELQVAISKGNRNGNASKLDNIAEEIIDVCQYIQLAIDRFDITPEALAKWAKDKDERLIERIKNGDAIFRNPNAKAQYSSALVDAKNQIIITRMKNDNYSIAGDVDNSAEYFHVLGTYNEKKLEKAMAAKAPMKKPSKSASKEIEKALKKATKKDDKKKGKKK